MIEKIVEEAYDQLSSTISVDGPIFVGTHFNFIVHGITDDETQIRNLCWCILGFLDTMEEIDMRIESSIGVGAKAKENLYRILCKRLNVDKPLIDEQITLNRNPLLQEIIGHVLVHIHKRRAILPRWLGEIRGCRNPHLNANDTGVDLVALGLFTDTYLPIIGEVKAYEKKPLFGFNLACEKFSQVRKGDYDDEIRGALKKLSKNGGISTNDLANAIWMDRSNFGAVVGYDIDFQFDVNHPCERKYVLAQHPDRLYLVSTGFYKMRKLFDHISDLLVELAISLGDE
jgi:hypothetical protein